MKYVGRRETLLHFWPIVYRGLLFYSLISRKIYIFVSLERYSAGSAFFFFFITEALKLYFSLSSVNLGDVD